MAGTWPTARAKIVSILNGRSVTAGDAFNAETLLALEFPPSAPQTSYPYCYVIPPGRSFTRVSGKLRRTTFDEVQVRFVLGGTGSNLEAIATRMEAWCEDAADAFDASLALDGTADVLNAQDISGLQVFENEGWGFEMALGLRLTETKTLGA